MSEVVKKKRPLTPLLLVVVFVLPVILAKLALDNDWFNKASTNRGELLPEGLDLTQSDASLQPKWRILYRLPQYCDEQCENALYSMQQIWLALGKESDRVEPLVWTDENSDQAKVSALSEQDLLKVLATHQQNVKKVFKDVPADGIFLVDTLGNIVLRYPTALEQQQAVMQSRDILADLRKLLKLSRIG